MSHHIVITFEESTLGRRYRAVIEYEDGRVLTDTLTLPPHDMEISGRPRMAVTWSFKCSFRRELGAEVDQLVEDAAEALLEAYPGAFG